ncbi:hypothetical protein CYMTET_49265 [Cymbomonas tetramitiformis]|uniref:Uncharacterized protein n=1 Tax=Cymbomonas tetramitiformis TaxID=36881 RepID=A0AAE0BRV7_9CHLO|nr:hypothetical protein CYMTET_49265 [Cymbomonas tetramitiformis]
MNLVQGSDFPRHSALQGWASPSRIGVLRRRRTPQLFTRQSSAPKASQEASRKQPCTASRRPARIILVRHGESEGNVDESVYQRKADWDIGLTPKGVLQAEEAGRQLREIIGSEQRVYFYVSPYKRAKQTCYHLGKDIERHRIAGVREEPRIREQDFGNFQDDSMSTIKRERLSYGRFFFRFPNGESASDVYDRITGFRETLRSDIDSSRFGRFQDEDDGDINLVVVSHGLALRVFLMRWYKWSVEQFNLVRNPTNCEIILMSRGSGGRFSLIDENDTAMSEAYARDLGLDDLMISDQIWQSTATPGELNMDWPTSGSSWFDDFDLNDDPRVFLDKYRSE